MRMRKALATAGLVGALTFGPGAVAGAAVEAPAPPGADVAPSQTGTSDDGGDGSGAWGLLGLVGLAGLLGLRRRGDRGGDVDGRRSFNEAMTSSTVS